MLAIPSPSSMEKGPEGEGREESSLTRGLEELVACIEQSGDHASPQLARRFQSIVAKLLDKNLSSSRAVRGASSLP
jgi:hypothetical protein